MKGIKTLFTHFGLPLLIVGIILGLSLGNAIFTKIVEPTIETTMPTSDLKLVVEHLQQEKKEVEQELEIALERASTKQREIESFTDSIPEKIWCEKKSINPYLQEDDVYILFEKETIKITDMRNPQKKVVLLLLSRGCTFTQLYENQTSITVMDLKEAKSRGGYIKVIDIS